MSSYFISTTIYTAIFYCLFVLLLSRQKTFVFNRFYLLLSLIIGLVLPFITFEISATNPFIEAYDISSLRDTVATTTEFVEGNSVTLVKTFHKSTPGNWLCYVYPLVSVLLLVRLLKNFISLLINESDLDRLFGMKVSKVSHATSAYSFFNRLYVPVSFDTTNKEDRIQLKHEEVHYKQRHSLDVLFIEFICTMFWFNPFVWLYRRSIKQNHEYLADSGVIKNTGIGVHTYSRSIVQSIKNQYSSTVSSGFNFHQSKNRIVMLQKMKSHVGARIFRISGSVVLVLLVTALSSFKVLPEKILKSITPNAALDLVPESFTYLLSTKSVIETKVINQEPEKKRYTAIPVSNVEINSQLNLLKVTKKPFVVLVDAGHGGKDPGHNNEKKVNLAMAKALEKLSTEEIKFVLLRDTDEFISLEDRVAKANELQPDFILSLHCNAHQSSDKQGIEVCYSDLNPKAKVSQQYAEELIKGLLENTDIEEGRLRMANFIILRTPQVPSIMLEMGFLTNDSDKAYLTNKESQEAYSKAVFESIQTIAKRS